MSLKVCPNCKTDLWLVCYYSVIVSLSEWRTLAVIALGVACFGSLLELSTTSIVIFSLIAAIPASVRFYRKHSCSKCGVEFVGSEKKAESTR